MNILNTVVMVLLIVGALNWGLVGLFNVDVVTAIFGRLSILTRLIFIIVGLAGVYAIIFFTTFHHPVHHDEHIGTPHPR
jgi:uncharacterized membrane protein YuzA (DUF378 family)